jgi:serine/threonine-protein kinase
VCVKVLRAALTDDPLLAQQFQDDGVALAALRHPNLVAVLDVGRTEQGRPFLMTEYVEGGDLRAFAARQERVEPAIAIDLVSQVLLGLDEAHGNGILHRDLEPSNVLLGARKDGKTLVKLVDFGLTRLAGGPRQGPDASVPTAPTAPTSSYLSPEQMLGMEPTFASDLYSVGVILFELLAGRRPFVARNGLELMQLTMMSPAPHLREVLGEGLPVALDALLDALLAKHPGGRPQGASLAREALLAIVLPTPLTVPPLVRRTPS